MRPKLISLILSGSVLCGLGAFVASRAADDKAKEKITYADHVVAGLPQPVRHLPQPRQGQGGPEPRQLRRGHAGRRLGQGHRAGRRRGQLDPGVITHKEEPKMPPNAAKIPDAEIELIRKWIEGGALETSGSTRR